MGLVEQLKLSKATSRSDRTPVGRFRRRLLEAVDLQLAMAEAELRGEAFSRLKKVWVKSSSGEGKQLREKPLRASRWWWTAANGTTFLEIRQAGRPLELAPGKSVIEVGPIAELPKQLGLIREAVEAGELDALAAKAPGRAIPSHRAPQQKKAS